VPRYTAMNTPCANWNKNGRVTSHPRAAFLTPQIHDLERSRAARVSRTRLVTRASIPNQKSSHQATAGTRGNERRFVSKGNSLVQKRCGYLWLSLHNMQYRAQSESLAREFTLFVYLVVCLCEHVSTCSGFESWSASLLRTSLLTPVTSSLQRQNITLLSVCLVTCLDLIVVH
jgi:hypothetical protein